MHGPKDKISTMILRVVTAGPVSYIYDIDFDNLYLYIGYL